MKIPGNNILLKCTFGSRYVIPTALIAQAAYTGAGAGAGADTTN
jgi:hypothetical protein